MKHTNINKLLFRSFFIFLSLCIISGCGVKGPLIENMPIEDISD